MYCLCSISLSLSLLLQIDALRPDLRQAVDGVHHEVEAFQIRCNLILRVDARNHNPIVKRPQRTALRLPPAADLGAPRTAQALARPTYGAAFLLRAPGLQCVKSPRCSCQSGGPAAMRSDDGLDIDNYCRQHPADNVYRAATPPRRREPAMNARLLIR